MNRSFRPGRYATILCRHCWSPRCFVRVHRGFPVLLTIGLCAAVAGCRTDDSRSVNSSGPVPPVDACHYLALSEVATTSGPDPSQTALLVELVNRGTQPIELANCMLESNGVAIRLPSGRLWPGTLAVVPAEVSLGGTVGLQQSSPQISVVILGENRRVVDELELPGTPPPGSSYGRQLNGVEDEGLVLFRDSMSSVGQPNPDIGSIRPTVASATFRPRDSSPNAALQFNGKVWVLGGWSHFDDGTWHSYTEVWNSEDGIIWELVNAAPPYIHYCSFVSWQGKMWAIGPTSYSSVDGVEWRYEEVTSPALNRSVVLGGRIINIHGASVRSTSDGTYWTELTNSAPWGDLEQPVVLTFRDRIWVIGGITGYGTTNQVIHTDVWSSSDGIQWVLESDGVGRTPRHWSVGVVHDDRIFLIGGWNPEQWPDQNGNSGEIWFTDDGKHWLRLPEEVEFPSRHASFAVARPDGSGVLVMAGYGHGGESRMYNDVWVMDFHLYFSRASGSLADYRTWGRNLDGTGLHPRGFGGDKQLFVIRNRQEAVVDDSWHVRGVGSRIVAGDGRRDAPLLVHSSVGPAGGSLLYVAANAKLSIERCTPRIAYLDPVAEVEVATSANVEQVSGRCSLPR